MVKRKTTTKGGAPAKGRAAIYSKGHAPNFYVPKGFTIPLRVNNFPADDLWARSNRYGQLRNVHEYMRRLPFWTSY